MNPAASVSLIYRPTKGASIRKERQANRTEGRDRLPESAAESPLQPLVVRAGLASIDLYRWRLIAIALPGSPVSEFRGPPALRSANGRLVPTA